MRVIPDTALYRTVRDQRFHGHQNLPAIADAHQIPDRIASHSGNPCPPYKINLLYRIVTD
jgi:hypothetical protein